MTSRPDPLHGYQEDAADSYVGAGESERQDPQQWFREGAAPLDAPLWWQLSQQANLVQALRALCSGPTASVQLRLWVFIELMALPQARLSREALNRHFHTLREEALDLALKPIKASGLLKWEEGTLEYTVPPLAQEVMALLSPLTRDPDEDSELGGLLAQVAGAHQLGTLQPTQLKHLQAQLARLHDEFSDAITSGSEFQLRRARARHQRVFDLIERASQVLGAITAAAQDHPATLRLAREIGLAQARLLAMKSQFDRALHQADRQRVTLGTAGVTTSDVRQWLRGVDNLAALAHGVLATPARPVLVSGHELIDTAEAEFRRDRPAAEMDEPLPAAAAAPTGELHALALPQELHALINTLAAWPSEPHALTDALLVGQSDPRYAAVAYRAQLLPLLGDPQAQALVGSVGDIARLPWRMHWLTELRSCTAPEILAHSHGWLHPAGSPPPVDEPVTSPPQTDSA